MATLNGARFLADQLDSLLAQTHDNWSLVVSDDGSRDATLDILRAFDRQHPGRNLCLIAGPRQGSAQNFMQLLMRHDPAAGMVALADQDDVWLPQKLSRAVAHLQTCPQDQPAIYAAESILTNQNLSPLRQRAVLAALPDFRNALVQNLFAGHSTVLNAAALSLVRSVGRPETIAFHDWWLYQLVAGAGGICMLDSAQTVLYRQHGSNAFGAAHGISAAMTRVGHLLRNDYGTWLCGHWQALHNAAPFLTPPARDLLRDLCSPTLGESRAAQFRRLGLHRASVQGTAALRLAAFLGRV